MYIVFTTILLLLIGDEHIEQLLYILLMMKKGLLLKKCECDEVRMCSSKKNIFYSKKYYPVPDSPPPSTAAAAVASTSKISNTFGALNMKAPKSSSKHKSVPISLALSIFGKTNCRKNRKEMKSFTSAAAINLLNILVWILVGDR